MKLRWICIVVVTVHSWCYTDSGIRVTLSTMSEKASRSAHKIICNLLSVT
jgi:hypothetical protein